MSEELGGSVVPLTKESVLEEPKPYVVDFKDWVADGNAEQVLIDVSAGAGATTTLYQVPKNYSFFLLSAYLRAYLSGAAVGGAELHIDGVYKFLNVICTTNIDTQNAQLSYFMPLKIPSEQLIVIDTDANTTAFGSISGFILPSKISIRA